MTLGPFDAGLVATGIVSGAGSTFFADVFRGDNLCSLAVGAGVEGMLIEAES